MLVVVAACSTYDESWLEERGGTDSASSAAMASADAAPEAADDAGHRDDPPRIDGVSREVCGDGEVSLGEKCDVAIPHGSPGACPRWCHPLLDCVPRALEGSGCQAECVLLEQRCANGDGCCAESCTSASDDDCSDRCGDGIVQNWKGETCEPASSSEPCAALSDCDDGDPCTQDVLTGGEANCNTSCSHVAIKAFASGDGCCPSGAYANSDGDCTPVCGNEVREPGEECDGGSDCDASCKSSLTAEQRACFALLDETSNSCDHCSCRECAPERLACADSGDATRDMHCAAIIQCANDSDCMGQACYCADAWCQQPGPCREVLDAAAASDPSGGTVGQQGADPNTAIGRAVLVRDCKSANCSDTCP